MARIFKGYSMKRGKLLIVIMGLVSASLTISACGEGSGDSNSKPNTESASPAPVANAPVTVPIESVIVSREVSTAPQPVVREVSAVERGTPDVQYTASQQLGIWVTGRGEVTTTPDLAILNAGVEARARTVEEARTQASQAMDNLVRVLKVRDIQDRDIQTRFFNISPEFKFDREIGRQELVGFRVDNQVSVKIRDIGSVGLLIDDVATAAGDLVRIQGITFTVEDTETLESQAREKAVQALRAKAQQLADLTGVQLGAPVFVSESGGFVPRSEPIALRSLGIAEAAPAPPTSISAGELTVTVIIQGTFSIIE